MDARSGGLIRVGVARGRGDLTQTTIATIGARSVVTAGADLAVDAQASGDLTVDVLATGGGVFVTVSTAESTGVMTFTTTASVGSLADLTAQGDLLVHATTRIDGVVQAQAFSAAGAFWGSAHANHGNIAAFLPNGLKIVNSTTVDIGAGARLTGRTASLVALVPHLHGTARAGAESFITVLVGAAVAYADADVYLNSIAQVIIHDGAARTTTITGWEGVDIIARHLDVVTDRRASRLAVGVIPPQAAIAGPCHATGAAA